jgi:tRNA modification GTPase
VRVSGPDAITIAGTLLPLPGSLEAQPSHTVRAVPLVDPETGARIDDALCAVMRAPRSYTGEDVVEFTCHGSPALLAMVVARLCRGGARVAAPGEFTRRAFVNGRLDLAQAEAVALLITARTDRAVTLAARALEGALGARVRAVREALLDVVAGLEVGLDFPDDEAGLPVAAARQRIAALTGDIERLLAAARSGRLVHEGVTVTIAGPPNAGKSSLFNMLLGKERAIVAPTPGTTRDVVEAVLDIGGVPVTLLDTAGVAVPGDPIEAEGMRRSRAAINECDLALLVIDGSASGEVDDTLRAALAHRRVLAVRSKSDLPLHPGAPVPADAIAISAVTGQGLADLVDRLDAEIRGAIGGDGDEGRIAASLRQTEGLADIGRCLRAAHAAIGAMPLEVALVDLREALLATTGLLGIELRDAVLDRIFATFCVGK